MKIRKKYITVAQRLKNLYNHGIKHVKVFYTRRVNGKIVPNYLRVGITAALIAAASTGAYYLHMHKKHGPVLHKKKPVKKNPPVGPEPQIAGEGMESM